MCCGCVERHTIFCRRKSLAAVEDLRKPNVCRRRGTEVHTAIYYDTIEEFSVDSKAECDQLNLARYDTIANFIIYVVVVCI